GAQERDQGDGIPAGEGTEDEDQDEDGPHHEEDVDQVAAMEAQIQHLRSDLEATRQAFTSERAHREEIQESYYRMRAEGVFAVLGASEKAVWEMVPQAESAPAEPEPQAKAATAEGVVIDLGRHRAAKAPRPT